MIRLTLAQMRRSAGRLTAAGIAIIVATAFVTATLLSGSLITSTTERAVTASLADADVVLRSPDEPLGPAEVEKLANLPESGEAEGTVQIYGQVTSGGRSDAGLVTPVAGVAALDPYEIADGSAPGDGEVALTRSTAERLDVTIGDTVTVGAEAAAADGTTALQEDLTVSGTITDPPAIVAPVGTILVDRPLAEGWAQLAGGGELGYDSVLLTAADGVSPDDLADAAQSTTPGTQVRTAEEEAQSRAAELTGGTSMLVGIVLAFAAVALFVAGIVITNTFQVLVAQRRNTLALLRCVGATRTQVHRSVLVESVLLGGLASLGGIAVGLAFGQGALWFLTRADLAIPVPEVITPSVATIVVPLLTGTAVTLLSALAPARAATRVTPVSALRPAQDPGSRAGGGRLRRALSIALVAFGTLLLVGAVATALSTEDDLTVVLSLGVGVLGGMISFAGVLVGAVFLVPHVVRAAGAVWARVARGSRSTVRLAAANAGRNPRRTSATASALLIGVALVTMMATGAASSRATLDATLDSHFPVDVMVSGQGQALTTEQVRAVAETEGVAQAVAIPTTTATVFSGGSSTELTVSGMDARDRAVLRDADMFAGLGGGTVLLGQDVAAELDVADGGSVRLEGPSGEVVAGVTLLEDGGRTVVVSRAALVGLDADAPVTDVWARLTPDASAGATVAAVQDGLTEVSASGTVPWTTGAAAEREAYDQIIDTLLGIVIGLLGVAVVIAVIGVANTLSLSVIERRHEHALLRAVGMTRGQLRGSLMVEGVLVALVGTVLGVALGLLYGWAGSAVVFGGGGELSLVVPWLYVAACAVGAVAAGLGASVLPARSAAKTPPVAALAA
ncbi:ABC transporter permease [Georgenia alba]|uniref:ABC transporter permease n=1 Tax=Georgenia alba TaxID=2233858 RepID=A0ABW2Q9W1_9MICO